MMPEIPRRRAPGSAARWPAAHASGEAVVAAVRILMAGLLAICPLATHWVTSQERCFGNTSSAAR